MKKLYIYLILVTCASCNFSKQAPAEGSKNDEYVFDNGVTIIGMSNLPGEVARDASQVFGNNIFNMIEEFWDAENKSLNFDLEDEILKGCVITHQGKVVNEAIK